jgi:Tol biopolymer transport system component
MMAKATRWGPLAAAAGTFVAVGLLLIMVLVVVESRPAEATFAGKPGKIAYQGYDGQDYEIYTINSGGGDKFRVTNNSSRDYDPCYSPSGKKIAYAVNAGNDWDIYTINSGGGSRAQLTNNNADDQEPSWGSS